ncbi:MAG: zf-HC2 domain-containing protein, partial [Woeseiaceae bacterium]
MSSPRDKNGCDRTDLLFEYALQTLPSSEVAVLEAHISACSHCRQEMETLRPIVDAFVSWPIDVLRPSASLWGRLAQRIAAETGEEAVSPANEPWAEP